MKKSFTLLEFIFVIVVMGIIMAVVMPNIRKNSLQEAAIQVISHIKYTQHLAMIDNKFDTSDANWYKKRWMIRFKKDLVYTGTSVPNKKYYNVWAYSIFSDKSGDKNPNLSEMAKNPLYTKQYLSGGYNNTLHVENTLSMKELRLGSKYGITNIKFSVGCRSNVLYVYFDYLGRPFNSMNRSSAYEKASSGWHKLLTSPCHITLFQDKEMITIVIEPNTGYAHILEIK